MPNVDPDGRVSIRIAALAVEGCLGSSIAILDDIVALVRLLVSEHTQHEDSPALVDGLKGLSSVHVQRLSLDGGAPLTIDGRVLDGCAAIAGANTPFDMVFIPSTPWGNAVSTVARADSAIGDWLKCQHEAGAVITAQGGSVFILAASGLLDGHDAAVFWSRVPLFRQRFPLVQPKAVETVTFANNLGCASTMAAGPTLICQALEPLLPPYIATALRQQVFGGGPPEAGDTSGKWARHDILVSRARLWLAENYSQQFRLAELADLFNVSERTISRYFNAAIGTSPHDYVRLLRFDAAMRLLRLSDLRIDDIARQVGYHDSRFFVRIFRDWSGMTPAAYRRKYRTSQSLTKPRSR